MIPFIVLCRAVRRCSCLSACLLFRIVVFALFHDPPFATLQPSHIMHFQHVPRSSALAKQQLHFAPLAQTKSARSRASRGSQIEIALQHKLILVPEHAHDEIHSRAADEFVRSYQHTGGKRANAPDEAEGG